MWDPEDTPLRECRECGRTERTRFEQCPHCGASYFARSSRSTARRRRAAIVAAAIVLGATTVLLVVLLRQGADDRARERVALRRAVAAKRAQLVRIQAPHRGSARPLRPPPGASPAERLRARRALVVAAERTITKDARRRAAAGELDGPISHTECGPIERRPDAVPDDRKLEKDLGRYDCVAVKADVRQGGRSVGRLGHPFVTTLDFRRFTYVWCRNTPAQSERGVVLVFVRLERACLAAKGKALGSGYLDVPGS